ncbi:hypothetical protein E4T80_04685 [Muribacter muris]|uniref:Uncharacterized protein n=1 Tax=Muribacter muris TaxID=67855 RepID=A0A4Y9JYS6_9PAST|nr:hypothetical protein [Muribacter muris]MBF0784777.1 hypothetical protein [Muribacter muris]MBF0826664.1 hypothetical protein [Muribacter muris]TFV11014.1 hypothetical protein E4T80_04685 [Muribacter muris]
MSHKTFRKLFKKELIEKMQALGYRQFPRRNELYFIKDLKNGFYTMVYITFNRFDADEFTGDLYLSLYPSGLYVDFSNYEKCYRRRVGDFLLKEERQTLLNPYLQNIENVGGAAWWYASDCEGLDNFIEALKISEPRFLAQKGIEQAVLNNKLLRRWYQTLVLEIIHLATEPSNQIEMELVAQPKTDPFKIGMQWFRAAEIYMHQRGYGKIKKSQLENFASQAYMTYYYQQLNGDYNPILLAPYE